MSSVAVGQAADASPSPVSRGAARSGVGRGEKRDGGQRALTLLRRTFQELGGIEAADRPCDAPAWMQDLLHAVLRVAAGEPCPDVATLARTPAGAFLDQLRTAFVARARRDRSVGAAQVLDLVAALDTVASEIRRERDHELAAYFEGTSSYDAIVEVAHDMRSPLNAILMLVRMVLEAKDLRPDRAEQLNIVYSAAFGLNALVNDLVDSAQPESRLLESAPVAVSVPETLQSVRDIVLPVATEKGLQLRIVAPIRARRMGHPAALHRVLLNLITNALKYTDSGTVTVRARELSSTRMEFTISDTGRGISRPQLSTLFQPFRHHRLSAREQSFSSGGLGLALCRALVASMGGRIGVESEEGRGTTFRIELDMPEAAPAPTRLLPEPWRDELAGDVAPTGTMIILSDRPLRIATHVD